MTVTIVTGGGSGIGAALCRRLAAPGARVLIHTGRRRDVAWALAAELEASGAETLVAVEDFAVPARAASVVTPSRRSAAVRVRRRPPAASTLPCSARRP